MTNYVIRPLSFVQLPLRPSFLRRTPPRTRNSPELRSFCELCSSPLVPSARPENPLRPSVILVLPFVLCLPHFHSLERPLGLCIRPLDGRRFFSLPTIGYKLPHHTLLYTLIHSDIRDFVSYHAFTLDV